MPLKLSGHEVHNTSIFYYRLQKGWCNFFLASLKTKMISLQNAMETTESFQLIIIFQKMRGKKLCTNLFAIAYPFIYSLIAYPFTVRTLILRLMLLLIPINWHLLIFTSYGSASSISRQNCQINVDEKCETSFSTKVLLSLGPILSQAEWVLINKCFNFLPLSKMVLNIRTYIFVRSFKFEIPFADVSRPDQSQCKEFCR